MAILVTLDVDDQGTVKITNMIDALSRLGVTYSREGKKVADTSKEAAKAQTEHAIGANKAANALDGFRMKALAASAALTLLAGGSYALLKESGMLAARVETLGVVMGIVSKNANLSSQEMRVQVETIKKLGITTQEASNAAIQFVQANLKLTDASKVARVAQDLAVISGQNSSQAFQTLTHAIQIQQPMLLRQFGIVTSLDQVYRDYAKTVGKTVKELDGMDKKQAFINLILAEGEKAAGAYEAAMGTAGKQMGSFARFVEEAKMKLGEALLPTMLLGVQIAMKLLEAWITLNPALQHIVTALMAAAVAMAAFGAAIAAANFLSAIKMIQSLTTTIQLFFTALKTGELVAFFGLFSPWGLALVGVAAAIGIATAAWVYFSKEAEIAVDKYADHSAAMESEIRTLDSAFEKYSAASVAIEGLTGKKETLTGVTKRTTEQEVELQVVTNKLEAEQTKFNSAVSKMIALAPGVANAVDGQVASYGELIDAIIKAKNARKDMMAQDLIGAEVELRRAEDQAKAARDAEAVAVKHGETLRSLQKMAASKGNENSFQSFGRLLKQTESQIADLHKVTREADAQVGRFTPTVDAMRRAMNPVAQANYNKSLVVEQVEKLKESVKDLPERLAFAKKSIADLEKFKTTGELDEFLNGMNEKWDKHAAELAKTAKKIEDIKKGIAESWAKDTPAMRAEREKYNEIIGNALKTGNMEDYKRALDTFKGKLLGLGTAEENAAKGATYVAAAIKDLEKAAREATLKPFTDEIERASLALSAESSGITGGIFKDMLKFDNESFVKREEAQREFNRKIFEMDRGLFEQTVVAKWSEVEQFKYAEAKKLDDLKYALDQEKRARQLEVDAEREMVKQRAAAARSEIGEMIRKSEMVVQIKANEMATILRLDQNRTAEQKRLLQQDADAAVAAFTAQNAHLREIRMGEITIAENVGKAVVGEHQKQVDQMNVVSDAAFARQVSASRQYVAEYIKTNEFGTKVVKGLFESVVGSTLDGFGQILAGTKSFKDVFIGIFQSIKNTILGIFNDIVSGWMKRLTQVGGSMAGASGGGASSMSGGSGLGWGMGMPMVMNAGTSAMSKGTSSGMFGPLRNFGSNVGTIWSHGTSGLPGAGAPGMWSGGGVGTSTGALGTVAGSAVGAGVGWGVGNWVGGKYGSGKGALAGAGAGAAAGGAMGGWIGAGVGAVVGGIGGWYGGKKESKKTNDLRDEYITAMGGFDELAKKAAEAGKSIDAMLSAKNRGDLVKEIAKLGLELKAAKDSLTKVRSEMLAVGKQAQNVGFDMRRLYDAKTIEEFNAAQKELNALLEAQQVRLAGLGTAAQGVNQMVSGMIMTLGKQVDDVLSKMGKAEREAMSEAYRKAKEGGFEGTESGYLIQQYQTAKTKPKDSDLSSDTMAKLAKILKDIEKRFQNIGVAATATFAGLVRETGDVIGAINAIGDSLDEMILLQQETGIEAGAAFQSLMNLRKVIKENEDVATSLSGITNVLNGLADAGMLTQEVFSAMGSDAAILYDTLIGRGVEANTAMLMMQPTLQSLWQAQHDYGFEVDATTQAIIDQAVEQGLVGEQFMSINQQMLDVLIILAETLGAVIPEAYTRARDASRAASQQQRDDAAAALAAQAEYAQFIKDHADEIAAGPEGAGFAQEDTNGQIEYGILLWNEYRLAVEAANAAAGQGGGGSTPPDPTVPQFANGGVGNFGSGTMAMLHGREAIIPLDQIGGVLPSGAGGGGGVSVHLTIEPKVEIKTWDGTGIEDTVRDLLGPALVAAVQSNTDQIARELELALARVRK